MKHANTMGARAACWALSALCLVNSALTSCPDAYWDCLRDDGPTHDPLSGVARGLPVPTGGGYAYGTCFVLKEAGCVPCNPKDEKDSAFILWKCNRDVLECEGRCKWYADLQMCCSAGERCGDVPPDEDAKQAICSGAGHMQQRTGSVARRLLH